METSEIFSKSFSDKFEEIGGYLNTGLKFDDGTNRSGWLFPIDDDMQRKLFSLLKKYTSRRNNAKVIVSSTDKR